MANRYWAEEKAPKADVRKALMGVATDLTNNQFTVAFESDDTGAHVCVYIERNPDDTLGWRERPPHKFMGWRVITMNVPNGYIPVFFNEDGTRSVTKSATNDDF